ncbi:MAG: 2-dehydropantoate 2-reductase [Nitrospinaceae bacterium]|nr:2-dehydropantoate 2-reductase [Nitrospinaceae bacterium]
MSRIAVLGVGAIGSIYGARLCAQQRHEVDLCVRQTFEKFRIETPSGVIEAPAHCLTTPEEAKPVEWVLLAVKCHQIKDVEPWLRALVGPGTIIAVLENGVEHVVNVAPYAHGAEILPAVVQCPADRLAPGHVVQNAMSGLAVPDNEAGRGLAEIFEGSDIEMTLTSDITTALWRKLCGNIARGPATALTNRGRGVVIDPGVAEVCETLVREGVAVGRAEGADLPESFVEKVVSTQSGIEMDATTSMLVDVRAGLPLEADGMTGAIIRAGERHGIETPLTRSIHALLSAINQ